jgi:hypothetical protein
MSFERLLSGPFFHWLRDRLTEDMKRLQTNVFFNIIAQDNANN